MNEALRNIKDRSKSFEQADFLPAILGEFRNEAVKGNVPVVLFGAGSAGKELYPVLRLHGVDPVCFCDNNPLRTGELYCGLPVISVSELRREHKDSLIVVTIGANRDKIKQQLLGFGFHGDRILTIPNQEAMNYYTHLAQWYWPEKDLLLYQDELLNAYHLLSDQKSRDIFASRIALFVGGADFQSFCDFISNFFAVHYVQGADSMEYTKSPKSNIEAYLQFNNDLIHLDEKEVFVDGGAYTGDSTLEFIDACARQNLTYDQIICFEPDPNIYAELQNNTSPYRNVVLRPFGLWSASSTIRFAGSNIVKPGSSRIVSVYDNNDDLAGSASEIMEISTTSIDENLTGRHITLIKMDVEGAEMEALRGAADTIKRCRPKLVISAYHKRNDLFEIPLLIHEMAPNYKMYFRHFSNNFGETTLFAIP